MNPTIDPLLTSIHNDRVKSWAALLEKKHRDRSGLFLIEGIHLVLEAFAERADIQSVVYHAERGIPEELLRSDVIGNADASSHAVWFQASSSVMAKCTGTDSPPPVFAVVKKPQSNKTELFRSDSFVVVLDGVRDPGNVGTIIRSADAIGAHAVILGKGCADIYNPKTVRSTMGSLFHLPILEGAELTGLLAEAKEHGIQLVGTSLQAEHTCYSYDWKQPTWLLMGSEGDGLSAQVSAMVNTSVIIPMAGRAESLNVSVAAGVLLFEALRQRSL